MNLFPLQVIDTCSSDTHKYTHLVYAFLPFLFHLIQNLIFTLNQTYTRERLYEM